MRQNANQTYPINVTDNFLGRDHWRERGKADSNQWIQSLRESKQRKFSSLHSICVSTRRLFEVDRGGPTSDEKAVKPFQLLYVPLETVSQPSRCY